MGNNPVMYTDPHGDTVRISFRDGFLGIFGPRRNLDFDNGNWYENGQTINASSILGRITTQMGDVNALYADPDGMSILNALVARPEVLTLRYGNPNGNRRDNNFVYWQAGRSLQMSGVNQGGGTVNLPAYIVLGHEVRHKLSQFLGLPNPPWYSNERGIDEIQATHFENLLRRNAGLPLREFYESGVPASRILVPGTRRNAHLHYTY